jgi:hypothetical protein
MDWEKFLRSSGVYELIFPLLMMKPGWNMSSSSSSSSSSESLTEEDEKEEFSSEF